jgi:hypothetical protein
LAVRSRQRKQFMPAPKELPHHGRADQACPTENEHAHDLPLLWKPAHRVVRLSTITTRRPRTNIAVQRGAIAKKHLNQNRVKQIFFAGCFGLNESPSVRFSPATDVLPFCGDPPHQTKFASRTFKIITGAAAKITSRLHRE